MSHRKRMGLTSALGWMGLWVALLLACHSTGRVPPPPITPASSVKETLSQHRALPDPKEKVWWEVSGPDMAWNNKNLHQIVPTVNVYRNGPVSELIVQEDPRIAQFPVETPAGTMPYVEYLASDESTTMGVVILHQGRIVFEAYPRMQSHEKPIWWSVTKVFVSTVLAILEDEGRIDVDQPVEVYVPELKGTAFEGVSVRDVLDMASGVDCPDGDYSDRETCYMQFEASLGDAVRGPDSPDNPYAMLSSLEVGRWAPPGTGFDYSGVNTFVLGWVVENVTGMPFQDALSRMVWGPMGAEADASILAGRNGIPLTSGGLLANPRDVARFGLLFTPSQSAVADSPIVSEHYRELLLHGGDPALLRNGRWPFPVPDDVRHNVYQWDSVFENDDIYKGGWAGQGLLVNPRRDLVAVWVGYASGDGRTRPDPLTVLRQVLTGVFGP
ncbi:MAG: serine hydrolase domain-containing protein [Myxococcota bacterium]|nr:serine hydrolase domain-containing protein [Myxococcota bacterium]